MSREQSQSRLTCCLLLAISLAAGSGCEPSRPASDAQAEPAASDEPTRSTPAPSDPAAPPPRASNPAAEPASPGTQGSGPQITFAKQVHDFGEIWDVRAQPCSFEFVNNGDQTLNIRDIKASCGCTTTSLDRMTFPPGQGDAISIEYTPSGDGTQRKTIDVISNASNAPVVELEIVATVKPFLTAKPRYIRTGTLEHGQPHYVTSVVHCPDPNAQVVSLKPSMPTMDAHVMDDERTQQALGPATDGARFPIEIRIAPEAPWGSYLGNVEVTVRGRLGESGEQVTHALRVAVIAELYGKVHASDSRFRLGTLSPGEQFESSIRLFSPSGETFDVVNARLEPALPDTDVVVQPMPASVGSAYEVTVRGRGGPREAFLRGEVIVDTNVAGEQRLRIPYSGRIR